MTRKNRRRTDVSGGKKHKKTKGHAKKSPTAKIPDASGRNIAWISAAQRSHSGNSD